MVRDGESMKLAAKWIIDHKKNKKFVVSSMMMVLVLSLLIVEFTVFDYLFLKIIRYIGLLAGLFFLSWIDGETHKIPNTILLILLLFRGILLVLECCIYQSAVMTLLISALAGAMTGGVIFGICYLISRGGIGAGDVKLFIVIGFFTGSKAVMAIAFLAVCVAAIYSIVQLIRKKTDMKQTIPFGPFVLVGTILTYALGI